MRFLPELGLSEDKLELVELDLKDKKILYLLSKNARLALSKIAKIVNLSRDSVAYRIKNLEKRGVLHDSLAVVDVSRFGYDSYHIFLRLNSPTREAELDLIEKIRQLPYVRALIKFNGKYDFEVAVIAKNILEFDGILTEIIGKTGNYLQDYELLIITENFRAGTFPDSFLKNFDYKVKPTKQQRYAPDKKDFSLIKIIRDNAQLSLLDISKMVKLSPDAVSYRLKKLVGSGVIINYSPVISYSTLGYNIYALLLNINSLGSEKEKILKSFLKNNDHILWAVKTVGRYNTLIYVCTKKEDHLHKTNTELRNLFPEQIKNYESLLAFAEYKYTYAPDVLFY